MLGYLQKGLRILRLDTGAIRDVYRDEEALVPALLFFAFGGVASGFAAFSFRGVVLGGLSTTFLSFLLVGLLHVLARMFGGTASFLELYRPLGAAAPVHWVLVVPFFGPFLGVVAGLYSLVVTVKVVETAGGLPRPRALAVVGLLLGMCLFLSAVFLAVAGSLILFRAVLS